PRNRSPRPTIRQRSPRPRRARALLRPLQQRERPRRYLEGPTRRNVRPGLPAVAAAGRVIGIDNFLPRLAEPLFGGGERHRRVVGVEEDGEALVDDPFARLVGRGDGLAVRLVVLLVVGDQVAEREAVVGGDEVDARVRAAAGLRVEVRAAREPVGKLAERRVLAAPIIAAGVAIFAVPLAPQRGEVADL